MKFEKGQSVTVTDYRGRQLSRVVWEDLGDAVLITSPEVVKQLDRGDLSRIPIRFPRASVSVARRATP
jgi:hypothetical protein